MLSSKLTAIVLKRSNFSEADKLVTVFSKERGKVKIIAKGTRRIKSRRAPHLELFNLVDLVLHKGKVFDLITEAKSSQQFSLSKENLEKTAYLFYLSEVLDQIMPEEQPHPEVFENLIKTLNEIQLSKEPQRHVKEFVVQLIWNLGYLPKGQYPKDGVTDFIEQISERKIRSKKFIEQI